MNANGSERGMRARPLRVFWPAQDDEKATAVQIRVLGGGWPNALPVVQNRPRCGPRAHERAKSAPRELQPIAASTTNGMEYQYDQTAS